MTDVGCLNKALKLKQFIRTNTVDHPIRTIQKYCLEKLGHTGTILQEYLALELKCIELYNSAVKGTKEATRLNWESFE